MVKTAIAFMLGCVLFLQLSQMPNSNWLWAGLLALILLLKAKTRLVSILMLGMLWTMFYAQQWLAVQLPKELQGKDILITGTISTIPEQNSRRLRFDFSPTQSANTLPDKIRLNWYKPLAKNINSGEQWQLTVRLKPIHGMSNPGSFDYEAWLFGQGIAATGYVRNSDNNIKLSSSKPYAINTIRQSLVSKINRHLNKSQNLGLIEGLTTGIRHKISPEQWQTLRSSGTSHLLAISGLHIGLAAAIGFFVFRQVWSLRSKNLLLLPAIEFAALGAFVFALFYAALAGFSIPTQRALLMVSIVLIGLINRVPTTTVSLLAASMLVILIVDPFAVLSPGFWLSFSAVGLIVYLNQNRYPSPKLQWLKIHGLLAIGLTPLLLFFFSQTSLISPIANFIFIPFISLIIVPLLLLASVTLFLFEPLGQFLLSIADYLLTIFWPLLEYLSSLPYASYIAPPLANYYILMILLGTLLLLSPRGFPAKWLGLIAFTPLVLFSPAKPNENYFWFTLLDVGQGLSAIVQTHNHVLVFDTGAKFSDSFDTGSAIVYPFLKSKAINHIDTLIISHGDNDHSGGALPLMKKIPIHQILSGASRKIGDAQPCYSDQSWQWDGIKFEILNPFIGETGSENNQSCVLKISNRDHSVLLTGDIEQEAEQKLILRYKNTLQSTVLVAPHHGSKTSSSPSFINTVSPQTVLIPVGYMNRYGLPHPTVLERYSSQHIPIYSTAKMGAISIIFGESAQPKLTSWREINHKIWTSVN